MRYLPYLLLAMVTATATAGTALAQPKPEFVLGFKLLADQIPQVVGEPVENERWGANGDSLQRTTTGLMVWRKADNWTGFTDGHRTWVNGPEGVQSRLNSERFGWEQTGSALTLDQLKNAEYRVEFVPGGVARLVDGVYRESIVPGSATEVVVRLGDQYAIGDLNGDGAEDAAAILVVDPGGSGTFYYLTAVLNREGQPEDTASAFLGDRVRIQSVSIESGEIVVSMLTRAPQDPMALPPTVEVTRVFRLEGGELKAVL